MTCSPGRERQSSSTPTRTTSLTFRKTSTPKSTVAHRDPTTKPWPPAMPASGWHAVKSTALKPLARRRIDFAASPKPTVGVEWEFALVDAQTRDLSNEAATVIAEIGENPRVHKELLRNTVEVVSGVCDSTAQAMEDLRETLRPARQVVRDRGMELFCPGAP